MNEKIETVWPATTPDKVDHVYLVRQEIELLRKSTRLEDNMIGRMAHIRRVLTCLTEIDRLNSILTDIKKAQTEFPGDADSDEFRGGVNHAMKR